MADSRTGSTSREPRSMGGWHWRFRSKGRGSGAAASHATAEPPAYDVAIGVATIRELVGEVRLSCSSDEEAGAGRSSGSELAEIIAGLLQLALDSGASDLSIAPNSRATQVRMRRDGGWEAVVELPGSLHSAIVAALRTMDRRRGGQQPGVIQANLKSRAVRFRFSVIQSLTGEQVTLRIPDTQGGGGLHRLGLFPDTLAALEKTATRSVGWFVVSGPAASGRTTTLGAVLNRLYDSSKRVMTLEDPVELIINGATQVDREIAVQASGGTIEACLQHAPDVLMVADPPESEWVALAEQAAGRLILTSACASSAAMVPIRLAEREVPRDLLARGFAGALNQRLARRLCEACKQPSRQARDLVDLLPQSLHVDRDALLDTSTFFDPKGCEKCRNTGYRGQIGLFEVLEGTPVIRHAIARGSHLDEIEELAAREGMPTLLKDGFRKVAAGITSLDEVVRVLGVPLSRTRTYPL